jgi:alkanesulfonate monooxygenase SsuD/methylene tetrahydromethanopterin reductase-like flavin-dependent oxidoreductase (luciferase family)
MADITTSGTSDMGSAAQHPASSGDSHPDRRMKVGLTVSMAEGDFNGGTVRYRDLEALAQEAEQTGLHSFWVPDHLLARLPETPERGCWEAFTFLSALAVRTQRILLGPMVAATSFRNPGLVAKMAVGLDELSDGRFILGLGAGWHEAEYTAFGFPFDHRAARFEEALQIIVPLLREGRVDFAGQYYSARECILRPRGPSRAGPPIWMGATKPRLLRQTARFADGFNSFWHARPEDAALRLDALRAACAEVGRDPDSILFSVSTLAHVLAPGEAPNADEKGIVGPAEEVAERLAGFAAIGTHHLLVVLTPADLGGLKRFARVVELLDRQ